MGDLHGAQLLSLDELMARLFTLITHHSCLASNEVVIDIVSHIQQLAHHPELEFLPYHRTVIAKMHQHWCAKLAQTDVRTLLH